MNKRNVLKSAATVMMAVMVAITLCISVSAASGYSFKNKGATATPGSSATTFLKKNGTGKVKKTNSCATKGYDITHTYSDFTLKTSTDSKTSKATETVTSITLTTSKVKTAEGVKIGDTQKTVVKKYGKGKNNFGVYTYTKGSTKINIEFDSTSPKASSKVTGIEIIKK